MTNTNCPFCNHAAQFKSNDALSRISSYICPVCGNFMVTEKFTRFISSTLSPADKAALSGYIREMSTLDKQDITISSENYLDILNSPTIARSVSDKLKKLVLYMFRKTEGLGDEIFYNPNFDYSICYTISPAEYIALAQEAHRRGYIIMSSLRLQLTYEGALFAEKLTEEIQLSDSAFVAMWFSSEMLSVYDNAIKPAIESEECGKFKAFRVDNHEHNNDITDEIIAGIKACRFMVADMTGYRGGVYYEAGFARGLGKPVIYTCRKDWFDGELPRDGKPAKERIHFDINHMNIIVWDDPEELKQRIINRIRATII